MVATVFDTTSLDSQVDGQVESLNIAVQACTAMTAVDTIAWNGFYAGWKAIHTQWASLRSGGAWYNAGGVAAELLFMPGVYDQMVAWQAKLPEWQERVKLACPNYTPPPAPIDPNKKVPDPNDPNDLANKIMGWAKVAGAVALVGGGLYAAVKVIEIVEVVSAGVKKATA